MSTKAVPKGPCLQGDPQLIKSKKKCCPRTLPPNPLGQKTIVHPGLPPTLKIQFRLRETTVFAHVPRLSKVVKVTPKVIHLIPTLAPKFVNVFSASVYEKQLFFAASIFANTVGNDAPKAPAHPDQLFPIWFAFFPRAPAPKSPPDPRNPKSALPRH